MCLFSTKACETAQNILKNIHLGYFSGMPGVQLYFNIGEDKHGLALYCCCHGTNDLEGGVHQNLIGTSLN